MASKSSLPGWMTWPFVDQEDEINPYGQLNPEQTSMVKQLGPYLQSKIGTTNTYTGDYTAPLTSGEQDLINQNSRLSALSQPTWEALMNPLDTNGELGSALNKYYQDSIYKPMLKQYQEDTQPAIEEQYAGSGGYWGGARADAVSKGYQDLSDTMASKRAELGWNALMNAQNAATSYSDYTTKSAAIQSIPRAIEQYGLTAKYNEWVRSNEESRGYIDQALAFLGLGTGTYKEGQSALQQISDVLGVATQAATLAATV